MDLANSFGIMEICMMECGCIISSMEEVLSIMQNQKSPLLAYGKKERSD